MSLSMGSYYTDSYCECNTNSYSTQAHTKSHNRNMKFSEWLRDQISEIGTNPTALARLVEGLNQPTVKRVLSEENPDPRIGTVEKIKEAVAIARRIAGLPPSSHMQFESKEGQSQAQQQGESALLLKFQRPSQLAQSLTDEYMIPQYAAGGAMGYGVTLPDQPGVIQNWSVSREWLEKNVRNHTSAKNLCIVTGFGPSMQPMYNPGDPLLVDTGVNSVVADGVYFFRVGTEGFIKQLQKIPTEDGLKYVAKSKNPDYDNFEITEGMDFEVLGRVVRVWCGTDF